MKTEKEKWVYETTESLEGIQRAQVNEGLHRKIMEGVTSMKLNRFEMVSPATVWRMAAGLFIIITLNVVTCIAFSKNRPHTENDSLWAFAREFSMVTDAYNY